MFHIIRLRSPDVPRFVKSWYIIYFYTLRRSKLEQLQHQTGGLDFVIADFCHEYYTGSGDFSWAEIFEKEQLLSKLLLLLEIEEGEEDDDDDDDHDDDEGDGDDKEDDDH